jgi:hypothetical protein
MATNKTVHKRCTISGIKAGNFLLGALSSYQSMPTIFGLIMLKLPLWHLLMRHSGLWKFVGGWPASFPAHTERMEPRDAPLNSMQALPLPTRR